MEEMSQTMKNLREVTRQRPHRGTTTSNNISRMQNQRLQVQLCSWLWAVCRPKHI